MKKFQFSLQSLLNVKQSLEGMRRIEMQEAMALLDQEQKALLRLHDDLQLAHNSAPAAADAIAAFFLQRERYMMFLRIRIDKQKRAVTQAEVMLERSRLALREANLEVRKLERKREQEHKGWRTEYKRAEQRINDEISSSIRLASACSG